MSAALDFIFELGVEEIPAGYFAPAIRFLEERLTRTLAEAHLPFGRLKIWGAPRRLAFGLWDLAAQQPDLEEEVVGPPLSAAYDSNGNPTRAATGFAGGQGVPVSDLKTLTTPKGKYLAVKKTVKGRAADAILAEILPGLLAALPFPKNMRWGSGEHTFVRPVHWILAVLDGEVLPLAFRGAKSDQVSFGHRFLHPDAVIITSPSEYEIRLAEAHVQVDFVKRSELVRQEIERVTREHSVDLRLVEDEDLVEEVANLLEEPVAVLGHFDFHFLDLPLAVAITAMKDHQRYFALTNAKGRLAPYFIAVNNTRARDMDVVRKGHERVLRARLDDARFYYNEDRRTRLDARIEALKGVVFHSLMGTSWEKVERFKTLALQLADDQVGPSLKSKLERAADLCKCDLITGVVQEFPTLQGLMGREYALKDGEDPEVAEAIYEHYLPNRAGGALPVSTLGAILSVADKLDTICGCFAVGLVPTGAADPFALRRGALGVINIFLDRGWTGLETLLDKSLEALAPWAKRPARETKAAVIEFFRVRLKSLLTGRGLSADTAEAVLGLYGHEPLATLLRAQALESLKTREGFRDLTQVFKRVVNIIKKFGLHENFTAWDRLTREAETALLSRVESLEHKSAGLIAGGDFDGLINEIADLRGPVDHFFEQVLVDDPDPLVKEARIALLSRLGRLFELVADFSRLNPA